MATGIKGTMLKTGVVAGAVYLLKGYVQDRFEEAKWKLLEEQDARTSLKRRLIQTREDIAFTVLTLIQTLADEIAREMDVEACTAELQSRSRGKARQDPKKVMMLSSPPESLANSVVSISDVDAANMSTCAIESSASALAPMSVTEGSERCESVQSDRDAAVMSASGGFMTMTATPYVYSSEPPTELRTRTTPELWNDVKILTLTRTLTTLYATTLLSLFTTLQLTLLARAKYMITVVQMERDERLQEHAEARISLVGGILECMLEGRLGLEDLLHAKCEEEDGVHCSALGIDVGEEVEGWYLTMSWWMLHVGWKDVAERVRKAVEEVFDEISLKSKVTVTDLRKLLCDVRRKVEYETTYDGSQIRVNFLSSLIPSTPETIHHVLRQGGFDGSPSQNTFHSEDIDFDESLSELVLPPTAEGGGIIADDLASTSSPLSFASLALSQQTTLTNTNTNDLERRSSTTSEFSCSFVENAFAGSTMHHRTDSTINDLDQVKSLQTRTSAQLWSDNAATVESSRSGTIHAFARLLDETRSVIQLQEFEEVMERCLERGMDLLSEWLEKNVFVGAVVEVEDGGRGASVAAGASTGVAVGETEVRKPTLNEPVRIRLAGMLPGMAKWSQLSMRAVPNELVDSLLEMGEVARLFSLVFGRFQELLSEGRR